MNAICPIKISPYDFGEFSFDKAKFCFSRATGALVGVQLYMDDAHKFAALDR